MTINYNAESMMGWFGLIRLFLRYHGTILSGTLSGPMFWIPNIFHLFFCFLGGRFFALYVGETGDNGGDIELMNPSGGWGGYNLSSETIKVRASPQTLLC